MGLFEKKVKDKKSKDLNELIKYTKEIWIEISKNKKMIKHYFMNYLDRINYVISIGGDRLTSYHYS